MDTDDLEIRSLAVGHLPLIRACIDQLGIMDVLNAHLPRHPLAKASDAECVAVMILNIMSGRVGLWRMDQRFEHIDIELLLGEGVEAEWFHDNRLGRALDHIDAAGTDTLLSGVVLNYLNTLDPGPFCINLDHTTVSVYGRYERHTAGPVPAFGHSKDQRPDLKQLFFSLALHGAAGIPLTMQVAPGNTSDHVANRDQLARLAEVLPRPDEATIVADCKLVDGETLGRIARAGFHFVSLMPRTIGERALLIDKAWSEASDASTWPVLATVAADRKDDPPRQYRGRSFIGKVPFRFDDAPNGSTPPESAAPSADSKGPVDEPEANRAGAPRRVSATEVAEGGTAPEPPQAQPSSSGTKPERAKPNATGEPMRCLVVHSEALARGFEEALPKKLEREVSQIKAMHGRLLNKTFACEADARCAMAPLLSRLELHTATVFVDAVEVTEKRPKRGRPAKDAPPPSTETVWVARYELTPNPVAIEAERRQASCFVLVTDWGEDEWDDKRVLAEYRHQSLVEGHTGFRWLKGPAAVAPIFLETPTRIRALGLVFVLALMVRNFVQYRLRTAMKQQSKPVAHPLRRTRLVNNLTTEMALVWFDGVMTVALRTGDGPWKRRPTKLADAALEILTLLKVDPRVFTHPPRRWKLGDRGG
jgi:transposase